MARKGQLEVAHMAYTKSSKKDSKCWFPLQNSKMIEYKHIIYWLRGILEFVVSSLKNG